MDTKLSSDVHGKNGLSMGTDEYPVKCNVHISKYIRYGRISTSESVLMNDLDFVYKCSVMRYACT